MGSRESLHANLKAVLGTDNVYFQRPTSTKMLYPCVVYSRSDESQTYANDSVYNRKVAYTLTVIDPDPDSVLLEKVTNLPMCKFQTHYKADNLNHDVYNIYY